VSGLSEARITIDAPAEIVWSVMVDLDRYGEWNPFILRITTRGGPEARVGDRILLRVRFGNGREYDSPERIVALEPPSVGADGVVRARLEYEYYNWLHRLYLVRGRRTQTLAQAPDGSTVYHTYERIHGLIAFVIPSAAITSGFNRHAQALKQRAEALTGPA
jgi:uncharacterized protein YndB with AHSA1/START domain